MTTTALEIGQDLHTTETDILTKAFRTSRELHGVEYKKMIVNGDYSNFKNIRQKVSYERELFKIEFANHTVKCYTIVY